MSVRARKLVGMVALVVLVVVYALVAVAIAVANLSDSSSMVHLAYFFFSGLLWIVPAMFIIKWMAKP